MSFNLDKFIASCVSAAKASDASKTISKLLDEAVLEPDSIVKEVGPPSSAKIDKLYVAKELTIINVVWAPKMTLLPHNHNMWAVIGVYCGREDNIFWRRLKSDPQNRIEAAGAKSIGAGEAQALGKNLIHSVTNPTELFTGAIHVYGGNFFENERSEWEPESLEERPYDISKNMKLFEAENELLRFREEMASNAQGEPQSSV